MYYKKFETYSFAMPREYKAYLAFKQKLRDLGQTFTDEGGTIFQEITVRTGGRFEIDEEGVILNLKEENNYGNNNGSSR